MLRLYKARGDLLDMRTNGSLKDIELLRSPLLSFPNIAPLFLEDSIATTEAFASFRNSDEAQFAVVTANSEYAGIVRRHSLDIIERSERFEAMHVPLRSVMTRSFVLFHEEITLGEAVNTLLDHKALGAIVLSARKKAVAACTIDYLLEQIALDIKESAITAESARIPLRALAV